MAIVVKNTNYNGEVLEQLLTLAATGNEIVETEETMKPQEIMRSADAPAAIVVS